MDKYSYVSNSNPAFIEDLYMFKLEDVKEYIDYWLKKNVQDEM